MQDAWGAQRVYVTRDGRWEEGARVVELHARDEQEGAHVYAERARDGAMELRPVDANEPFVASTPRVRCDAHEGSSTSAHLPSEACPLGKGEQSCTASLPVESGRADSASRRVGRTE